MIFRGAGFQPAGVGPAPRGPVPAAGVDMLGNLSHVQISGSSCNACYNRPKDLRTWRPHCGGRGIREDRPPCSNASCRQFRSCACPDLGRSGGSFPGESLRYDEDWPFPGEGHATVGSLPSASEPDSPPWRGFHGAWGCGDGTTAQWGRAAAGILCDPLSRPRRPGGNRLWRPCGEFEVAGSVREAGRIPDVEPGGPRVGGRRRVADRRRRAGGGPDR